MEHFFKIVHVMLHHHTSETFSFTTDGSIEIIELNEVDLFTVKIVVKMLGPTRVRSHAFIYTRYKP